MKKISVLMVLIGIMAFGISVAMAAPDEIKIQDVVISENCAEYLIRVSHFVDDLLEEFYGLERFYNITQIEDLVGQLIVGLAPHTSAGVLGRIVGFTKAACSFEFLQSLPA